MSELITNLSFDEIIEANRTAGIVPTDLAILLGDESYMRARLRGAYIMDLNLSPADTDPLPDPPEKEDREAAIAYALAYRAAFNRRVDILYSDPLLSAAKLDASFTMSPAGPYKGMGGNHGFPRWADFREISRGSIAGVEESMILQAETPGNSLGLRKEFLLGRSALSTFTTLTNGGDEAERTSLGEHLYFRLPWGDLDGLTVNGQHLDKLTYNNYALQDLQMEKAVIWNGFKGLAEIRFPAGHILRLTAAFTGFDDIPLSMWIWRRKGSPSICFEPVVGAKPGRNDGITVVPGIETTLTTRIDLLHSDPEYATEWHQRHLERAASR